MKDRRSDETLAVMLDSDEFRPAMYALKKSDPERVERLRELRRKLRGRRYVDREHRESSPQWKREAWARIASDPGVPEASRRAHGRGEEAMTKQNKALPSWRA